MRLLALTLLAAVAALVAVVALVAVFQERVVWQPPAGGALDDLPEEIGRRVEYVAADGQPLHGYLVVPRDLAPVAPEHALHRDSLAAAPDDAARARMRARDDSIRGAHARRPWNSRVLIAFHGNAETAHLRLDWAGSVAHATGWTIFLPEYRGYAGLPGAPTYAGSQADARAAYVFVRDSMGVAPERIGIHGFSLGTAVATELAHEVRPRVLVLEAPFTSARDMARAGVLLPARLLWRWIARVHFDTRSRVDDLDAPVWVVHGGRDIIVPVRMGRAVHAAARVKGEYLEIPDAGHNDLAAPARHPYWRWLGRALAVSGDAVR